MAKNSRVFNLLGETVDNKPAPETAEKWPIHRDPPSYEEQVPATEKHRSPPIRRNRKSRAVAVRRKRKRLRLKIRKRRNRLGPARAAHPRRIRRPLTSPSRPNETKCPEVTERPRMPRSP